MRTSMKDFVGKVAFITGGASGIGLGIARAYACAGMNVAIGYHTRANLDQVIGQLSSEARQVHPVRVDVSDRREIESAAVEVERVFGKIHVLVNNAGIQHPASLSEMSYEEWDRLMAVNVGGVFNGLRAFLPRIKRHGEGGHIIATASVLGLFTAGGGYAAYCASKFAVVAMMESLRSDLHGSNIGVSVLCPGAVRTNLEESLKNAEAAADPMEIGRRVLRGMRNNDLYILTHPEFGRVIQCRNDAIIGSMPTDICANTEQSAAAQSLLQRSIYLMERNRQHPRIPVTRMD